MAHAGLDDARDSKAKGGGGARKGAAGARCERRRGAGASRNNFARRTASYGRRLARKGERQGRQLLEESIYSADDTLSRLLFLLHVSEGSWAAGRALYDAGRSAGDGRRRAARRLQGGTVQPGRSTGADFPRSAGISAGPRLSTYAGLFGGHVRAGARAHRALAACESRRDGRRGA